MVGVDSPTPYYDVIKLTRYIEVLEKCLGKRAIIDLKPMQPGDMRETWADISKLQSTVAYSPGTQIEYGVGQFVEWYLEYYKKS